MPLGVGVGRRYEYVSCSFVWKQRASLAMNYSILYLCLCEESNYSHRSLLISLFSTVDVQMNYS